MMPAIHFDSEEIETLRSLRDHGLTEQHLLALQLPGNVFCRAHREALECLIRQRHLTPDEAIAQLQGSCYGQARAIIEDNVQASQSPNRFGPVPSGPSFFNNSHRLLIPALVNINPNESPDTTNSPHMPARMRMN